jgi:hypothetical protein
MQLPASLVANRTVRGLPNLPVFPVALHRGQSTATPAVDALHALLSLATQGALAGLTQPQRVRRKA